MIATWLLAIAAACTGEPVVVAPFEPLATSPAVAREVEERVRKEIAATAGLCVEERGRTIRKLAKYENQRLPVCADETCSAAQARAMEAKWLLTGVVLGVGGRINVSLTLSGDVVGKQRRTTVAADEEGALAPSVRALFLPGPAPSEKSGGARPARGEKTRLPAILVASAGAVSLAAGGLLGAASQRTARSLEAGATGCSGTGEAYRDCFDARIRQGREQAAGANLLFGAGALLLAGASVMFVFELP